MICTRGTYEMGGGEISGNVEAAADKNSASLSGST